MPATLWDTNYKGGNTTLSGGSLTATFATASFTQGVGATRNLTGKTYLEMTPSTMSGVVSLGLAGRNNGGLNLNGSSVGALGTDVYSVGYRNAGTVLINGATVATIQSYVAGNVVQMAIDTTVWPPLIWFNVNNGNWNNNAANNPATGVGGISLATMTGAVGGPLLPTATAAPTSPAAVVTAAFSSAGWSFTAPSGFVSVDTTQASARNANSTIAASYTADGPARTDAVTTTAQRSVLPLAAGAWYGNHTRVWSPAAGAQSISGTVTELGAAAAKTVRLYDRSSGELLYQTTSSAVDGSYAFNNLNPAITYDVVAFDLPNYDALIFDNVAPA